MFLFYVKYKSMYDHFSCLLVYTITVHSLGFQCWVWKDFKNACVSQLSQIHNKKYDFNQRLLSLRDKKIRIIDEIRDLIGQLVYVQGILGPEKSRPLPSLPRMYPDEMPEK